MYSNYHLYKIPYILINSVEKLDMAHDGHICLLPNQKIICSDITKNIEDIKFGDEVLTHKGRFSKVIGTSERHYEGKINIIRTNKFNSDLKVTKDHPILVAIPNIIIDEKNRHFKKDFIYIWKNAFTVDKNDFLVFPIIKDIDKKGLIHGSNLLLPVKSNITQEYSGMVYNLNVENDNTFVTLNGVVHNCLDEFWLYVDSRSSASTKNRVTSNIILKSRKRDLTFMFTSQLLDLLDKRVRKILDFTAYTILNPNESVGKTLIFRGGYPKEAMILKTMRFYTAGVFQLYNTREEINMIEDDGQPPKIIFQESPDYPPKYFDTWEACDAYGEAYWAKHPELISLLMAGQ